MISFHPQAPPLAAATRPCAPRHQEDARRCRARHSAQATPQWTWRRRRSGRLSCVQARSLGQTSTPTARRSCARLWRRPHTTNKLSANKLDTVLKHQHDGVYLQSEPPCSRADAYKKSSNPSTSDFPLRPFGQQQQPRSEHAGGGVTAEQLDQHGFPLRDARSQRQHWQNDPLYNGATSLAARDILVSHPGSRDPGK